MIFSIKQNENYTAVISNVDKLDSLVVPELKSIFEKLNNEGQKYIILDLARALYCDSMGLSTMLTGNKIFKNSGGALVICNIQPLIEKMLIMSNLKRVLNITPTFEDAVDFLKKN